MRAKALLMGLVVVAALTIVSVTAVPQCTDGDTTCWGKDLLVCEDEEWGVAQADCTVCGGEYAPQCTDGDTTCWDKDLLVCEAYHWAVQIEDCTVCGGMFPPPCMNGDTTCWDKDLLVCENYGWTLTETNSATCGYIDPNSTPVPTPTPTQTPDPIYDNHLSDGVITDEEMIEIVEMWFADEITDDQVYLCIGIWYTGGS